MAALGFSTFGTNVANRLLFLDIWHKSRDGNGDGNGNGNGDGGAGVLHIRHECRGGALWWDRSRDVARLCA